MAGTLDIETKQALIRNQVCFAQLTPAELDVITPFFIEKHFKAHEVIVHEGEPVEHVFLIASGEADVRQNTDKDHPEKTESVAKLGPKAAIGLNETGFYSISGVRTATVVALTDMVLLSLSMPAFHGFSLAYPHVNDLMRKYVAKIMK